MTAHLIARTLSRRTGLPWIAESRDPVAARRTPDDPHLRRALRLEGALAREATTMVMPTPTWAAHYGALWHTDVAVLSNGYDGQLPERRLPAQQTLAHIGTYHAGRDDFTALWEALAVMRRRQAAPVPRVRFVGHPSAELDQEISRYGLEDLVDTVGFVSHDEAMVELMSASMLVASGIKGDDPVERGWVPARCSPISPAGCPCSISPRPTPTPRRCCGTSPGATWSTTTTSKERSRRWMVGTWAPAIRARQST